MFDIIVNLQAGKGKSRQAFDAVTARLNALNIPFTVHATEYAGHAKDLAAMLTAGEVERKLIVLGGDGSFNEVLNGVVDFRYLKLGLIPCGTGNDFARAASIPTDPLQALEVILKNTPSPVDYIEAGERRALNCAGAGMDVDVLVRYATMKAFHGKIKYYASLIDTLIHLKFHRIRLTMDGVTREEEVFMVAATNGTCIGGGMPLSPRSKVEDGMLNLVMIRKLPKRKIPLALIAFLQGKHIDKPYTEEHLVKDVKIEILDKGKTEVDGEVLETKILDCKIVSDTLYLYR